MNCVSIVTEPGTVAVSQTGPVTGCIWLEFNGNCFPEHAWNDLVIVVMGWWLAALLRLQRQESQRETIDFMDGPYRLEISRTETGMLSVRAFDDQRGKDAVATGETPLPPFVAQATAQAVALLEACRRNRVWSKDEQSLHELVEKCQAALTAPQ